MLPKLQQAAYDAALFGFPKAFQWQPPFRYMLFRRAP